MELSNEFEVAAPLDQAWAVLTDLERIAPCLPGAQLQEIEGDDHKGTVKVKVGPITAQYKGVAKFVEKDDAAHRAVLSATGRDTRGQGNASASIVAQLEARGDDATHVSILTDLAITGKVAQFGRGVMADVSAKLLDQFVVNLETTVLADLASNGGDASAEVADAPVEDAAASGSDDPQPAPAAVAPSGSVARKAKDTTEMLASELAKAWEEAKEGADEGDEPKRVERERMAPRPDLLVAASDQPDAAPPAVDAPAAAPVAPAAPERRLIDSPEAEPIDLLGTAGSPVLQRLAPLVGVAAVVLVVLAVLRRRRGRRS